MCGVIGMVAQGPANQALYDGLTVLQHRGQDAAGIMTYDRGQLYLHKGNGLVRDVFRTRHMQQLAGRVGIGHVRYPTAGCSSSAESQPFYVNSPYGISLAHNGNLTNAEDVKRELFLQDLRHINTASDSEVLLNVLAHELGTQKKLHIDEDDLFTAVANLHERCQGAYAAVAMINGYGVLAFRDPFGIRPLCFGRRHTDRGTEYMIASESVALNVLGFELVRDVSPGEAVFIDLEGQLHSRVCVERPVLAPCIFEYVYLARPDSVIDGIPVYESRLNMGRMLAERLAGSRVTQELDVIIPIPDTSRTAALDLANELGVTYREGFIKNRYIGRTFIMPGQAVRQKSVRQKLNPIKGEFAGKNVLLVDDSIVRGTTAGQIVQLTREAGARRVYLASAAPPIRYPNVYGIDMPAPAELVASNRSEAEVAAEIGADGVVYQDLEGLTRAVRECNPAVRRFDCSCFDGQYVTGTVTAEYLREVERLRADDAKQQVAERSDTANLTRAFSPM